MNSNPVEKLILFSFVVLLFVSCNRTETLQVSKSSINTEAQSAISKTKAPVGYMQQEESIIAGYYTASNSELLNEKEINSQFKFQSPSNNLLIKEEEDSTKVEPKYEPLVLGGTATAVGGLALGLLGLSGAGILLLIGAGLLIVSAIITMIGWKKIKADPKKFKGEKLAIINYIIIGICGVAASFYLLYLLFTF